MTTRFRRNSMRCAILLLAIASGINLTSIWAQFSSSIEGTVTDSSSAAVPGATIMLLNNGTGIKITVQTNGAGYYLFPSLPAGLFSLTASGTGFKTNEISDIRLESGARRTANVMLEVGAQATVVTVKAEVAAVDLSDAKVAGLIERTQIVELPIAGRNYMALVNLTPGVTGTLANADIFNAQAQVNINAGGLRGEQNGFAVDGGTTTSMVRHGQINLQPNAESIEEVQITVNDFSAAAGNDAGASVKVTTKAGTNDFHGSASWFHTDNVLSSRSIFQNTVNQATGRVLPVSRKNEAAGSFGGPVKKNRTFLFATFDILRQGTAPTGTTTVETPDLVNYMSRTLPNNKSTFLLKNYPAAFAPYTNFRTAGSLLGTTCSSANPSALIASAIGPVPCNLNVQGDGVTPVLTLRNGKQWSVRGDHLITEKDRFYANVFRDGEQSSSGNTTRPTFLYLQENLNWVGTVNETHTFSSRLLNEVRVNAVRVHGEIKCIECQIPAITVTGGFNGYGIGGPTPYFQDNYELQDTLTWIKGNHNMKAGFGITRLQANWKPTAGYQRPAFAFNSLFDFLNDNPTTESNLGLNPKDGTVYTPDAAEREHTENAFFDDTWKVRPNLTVTLGLRWEAYGLINQNTLGNNVQFLSGNDTTSRIADGKNVTKYTILDHGDWNNFAPRLNFAWDPKGDGKTSIRGGAGIFYDYLPSQLYGGGHFSPPLFFMINASAQTAPLLPLYAFGASKTDPYNFPRPPALNGILTLDAHNGSNALRPANSWVDPSLKNSYTEKFFFGVQRALTSTLTIEGNFVSDLGRHIYSKYDVNRFPGDLIQNNGVAQRLNPSFGSIGYAQANMTSSYNGGNFSVRQRYSHGLLFQAAYTFGHAIDMADSFSASASDWWNLKLERATAGYNANQKLALSAVYLIPTMPGASAMMKTVTGGWQLSGLTILQSGSPFSVSCGTIFTPIRDAAGKIIGNSGCDFNADTATGDRPNAPVFGSTINMDKQVLIGPGTFKASDFPKPALGQLGTLGRNTFVNPGYADTDLAILRNFKAPWFTSEKLNVQFRAEAFNAFNRVNLGGIQGAMENTNFGKVTSIAGNPRRFQFGLRVSF
jgi:Carboxypeptidase regulatory-like domain